MSPPREGWPRRADGEGLFFFFFIYKNMSGIDPPRQAEAACHPSRGGDKKINGGENFLPHTDGAELTECGNPPG